VGGRRWTETETDWLRKNLGKKDFSYIVNYLHRTAKAIQQKAWDLGLGYLIDYSAAPNRKIRKKQLASKRELYQRRVDEALCTRCGVRFAEAGGLMCPICRAKTRAWNAANDLNSQINASRRALRAERKKKHLCYDCGAPLGEDTHSNCERCRRKRREWTQVYRMRLRIHGLPRPDVVKARERAKGGESSEQG
jgi:hypothetical protein